MTEGQIRTLITARLNEIYRGARLTTGITFLPGDAEGSVKLVLSDRATGTSLSKGCLNMQEGTAAFEAWALLIHAHCGLCVQLDTAEGAFHFTPPYHGHYGRFLYRTMKFSEQYSDWFSLSDSLKVCVDAFRMWLCGTKFCNNYPTKEAQIGTMLECQVETAFAKSDYGRKMLVSLSTQGGVPIKEGSIYHQLPVGLFAGKKCQKNSVFTYGKSAIDLWAFAMDGIAIYELKARNRMVGILTELMFYANYMYDLYVAQNTMQPVPPKDQKGMPITDDKILRGYNLLYAGYGEGRFTTIYAAMLTDALHPLITPDVVELMNTGHPQIRYYDLRYELGLDGGPCILKCV